MHIASKTIIDFDKKVVLLYLLEVNMITILRLARCLRIKIVVIVKIKYLKKKHFKTGHFNESGK